MGMVNLPPDPPFYREERAIRSYPFEATRTAKELDGYGWKLARIREDEAAFSPETERQYALMEELQSRIRTYVQPELERYHQLVRDEMRRLRDEVRRLEAASREARIKKVTDHFMDAKRSAERRIRSVESLDRDYVNVKQFVRDVLGRVQAFRWPGPARPKKRPDLVIDLNGGGRRGFSGP